MARIAQGYLGLKVYASMIFSVAHTNANREYLLTVIVPISRMAGKINNLKTWISSSIGCDLKIILVHDVQDADTGPQLKEFISSIESEQIVFIEKYFGSPGLARNAGLELTETQWCCFWDSDDIPDVERVFYSIHASSSNADVIISNFRLLSQNKSTVVRHNSNLDQVAINPGLWRMVFKTNTIKDKKFTNLHMGEDQIFLLDVDLSNRKIEFSNAITYSYRTELEGQLTKRVDLNSLDALTLIQTSILNSRYNASRFISIVYIRLFASSIKRLKFKYPVILFVKNFCFIFKLKKNVLSFVVKMSLLKGKKFQEVSRSNL